MAPITIVFLALSYNFTETIVKVKEQLSHVHCTDRVGVNDEVATVFAEKNENQNKQTNKKTNDYIAISKLKRSSRTD